MLRIRPVIIAEFKLVEFHTSLRPSPPPPGGKQVAPSQVEELLSLRSPSSLPPSMHTAALPRFVRAGIEEEGF